MTIDNAWDEKWSSWIDWNGGECPLPPKTFIEAKYRDGTITDGNALIFRWDFADPNDFDCLLVKEADIIAYRYKIKEPAKCLDNAWDETTPEEDEAWQAKERSIFVPDTEADNVNKPKHYQLREGYEVYDLRQDLAAKAANGGATYDQYSDWDRAIEYIIRMWGKNRLEDAKKGRWYLDKLIGKLEAQE